MQEPSGTLSPQQRHALESVYSFLTGVRPTIESLSRLFIPESEKLLARNLEDWAELVQHRLVEAFPEILTWVEEWKRGGAQ